MQRLIKKAWDEIELYHHTSSQLFIDMVEEGYITPGGYNNKISGGGHVKIWDLADNKVDSQPFELKLIDQMKDSMNDKFIITRRLINYLEQRKEENPDGWEDETVDVFSDTPSGNENGVYLTSDADDEYEYAYSAISKNTDNSLPNLCTSLKINVQIDALSPDYDDLDYFMKDVDKDSPKPLWKQSLESIGQVAHNGPIDINNITGVKFLNNRFSMGNNFENDVDFYNFAENIVSFETWLSVEEAYNQLNKLHEEYLNIGSYQLASKRKRLMKRS